MKLLTKTELQRELAVERKMQIDEGIALARKVDGLRRTAGSEEAQLEQFRTGTIAEVQKEIAELIFNRDQLKVEVNSLEEQRDTALEPLHVKEAEVDKKLEQLEVERKHLEERVEMVAANERAVAVRMEEASAKEGRADSLHETASQRLVAANDILLAAKVKESQVNGELNVREARVLGREMTVLARENAITARERDAHNKLQTAKQKEKATALREAELLDREQTYQRNVERDGKRSTGRK